VLGVSKPLPIRIHTDVNSEAISEVGDMIYKYIPSLRTGQIGSTWAMLKSDGDEAQ
jgi:hypothetical protein